MTAASTSETWRSCQRYCASTAAAVSHSCAQLLMCAVARAQIRIKSLFDFLGKLTPPFAHPLQTNGKFPTVRKIFMGSTAQHHLTDGGYWVQHGVQEKTLDYMARGGFPEAHMSIVRDKPNGVGGCAKDRFRDGPDWRDATALATLQQAFGDVRLPTVARGRERMCRPVEDPGETVWFIPVADRMAPLYSQHDTDCTHYCLNPNVFDAQHDGLARTMADALGTCDEVNRRRGAQGWGDELLYSDIGSRKKPGKSNEPGPNFQIEEFRNCSTNDVYNCCNTKYMYRCKPV